MQKLIGTRGSPHCSFLIVATVATRNKVASIDGMRPVYAAWKVMIEICDLTKSAVWTESRIDLEPVPQCLQATPLPNLLIRIVNGITESSFQRFTCKCCTWSATQYVVMLIQIQYCNLLSRSDGEDWGAIREGQRFDQFRFGVRGVWRGEGPHLVLVPLCELAHQIRPRLRTQAMFREQRFDRFQLTCLCS